MRVERELENRVRLRAPRELRVPGLVGEGAEPGRLVDADEEVGDPAPALGREDALVDDVDACAERLLGAAGSLGEPVLTEADLDDLASLFDEPREEGRLVLVALACDELGVRVVARCRQRHLAALDRRRELGQVRAGEVGREVGRGEQQRAVVGESHHLQYQLSRVTRLRTGQARTPLVSSHRCRAWPMRSLNDPKAGSERDPVGIRLSHQPYRAVFAMLTIEMTRATQRHKVGTRALCA